MDSAPGVSLPVTALSLDDCGRGIPEVFERVVRHSPEAIALCAPGIQISYDQLNRRANGLAHALLAAGMQRGEVIAVAVEAPPSLAVCLLGILKAGGVIVFLDHKSPPSRHQEILTDSEARLVVVETSGATPSEDEPPPGAGLARIDLTDLAGHSDRNPETQASPDALMAVYYTSGTTNRPKGICRTQAQGIFEAWLFARTMGLGPHDRMLMPVSFTFGASTRYALGALLTGAMLCPVATETLGLTALVQLANEIRATQFYGTPSLFRHFCQAVAEQGTGHHLRAVTLTGEPVLRSDWLLFRRLMGSRPGVLLNSLGSTECGAYCHLLVTPDAEFTSDILPVGAAVEGKEVFIVDEHRRPVPPGQTGEIAVRSAYLAHGYWNRPDLNRELFETCPEHPGQRTFYTGDLGVQEERGWIRLVGRRDLQLKVRGYRVEPGEIESVLCRHPGVRGAVVLATESPAGPKMLVAYLQPTAEGPALLRRELDHHLLSQLPAYMLPARFWVLDTFPLTARGKIDRRALPNSDARPLERSEDGMDRTDPTLAELRQLWTELLGSPPPDSTTGFFEMGGDSLQAMHLLTRVRTRWGLVLPVAIFYQSPTMEALARWIAAEAVFGPDSALFPMNDHVEGLPELYLAPGWMRNALELSALAQALSGRFNCFGLEFPPGGAAPETIEGLATECVRIIATRNPTRPVYLAGFSLGGLIAYETGRQMSDNGAAVARVFILDSVLSALRPPLGVPRVRRFLANFARYPRQMIRFLLLKAWQLGGRPAWIKLTGQQDPTSTLPEVGPMPQRAAARNFVPRPGNLPLTLALSWERRLQLASEAEPWQRFTRQPVRWVQLPVCSHDDFVAPSNLDALVEVMVADLGSDQPAARSNASG